MIQCGCFIEGVPFHAGWEQQIIGDAVSGPALRYTLARPGSGRLRFHLQPGRVRGLQRQQRQLGRMGCQPLHGTAQCRRRIDGRVLYLDAVLAARIQGILICWVVNVEKDGMGGDNEGG